MKEYAERFYKSKQWQACRLAYMKSVGGLCENCLRKGYVVPGEIVHHKVHISPQNIESPETTLSFDNLELLCRNCHAEKHGKRQRRYTVDETGKVEVRG